MSKISKKDIEHSIELKKANNELPIHAKFWEMKEQSSMGSKEYSAMHNGHIDTSDFHKPISTLFNFRKFNLDG